MPQHTASRLRWSLLAAPLAGVLLLAGCTGAAEDGGSTDDGGGGETLAGFSVMVAQANDQDDYWAETAAAYTEETGVEIEVIPYPSDAYNTQVTTQLQAGNAADMMILAPGTGQAISIVTLAEAGFLEPLNETSAGIIPEGTESLYEVDGEIYGQPAALVPVGLIYNGAGGEEVGIDAYPETFDEMLEACTTARDGGKTFTVLAGGVPFNTGLMSMLISATRVYQAEPDWNEQRAAGDVTFVGSGWEDVLNDIITLNENGCFQDGVEGGTFDTITQGIGGQTSLTAAVPGSAAISIGAGTGLDLTVQAFPPADGQEAYTLASANYAWAVNAASDDDVKASAQAFLDWLATPEQVEAFADLSGLVPISGATADNVNPVYEPIADLIGSGSFAGLPNATWPNPAVYEKLGTGVQGLLTGQKTVDQVLEEMDAAWG